MKPFSRIAALLAALFAVQALACRYSVRDTGFVDLGEEQYQLILSGGGPGARTDLYRRMASATFQEANIRFAIREERDSPAAGLQLQDTEGRRLDLAAGAKLPEDLDGVTRLMQSIALSNLRSEIQETALKSYAAVVLVEGRSGEANARVGSLVEEAIRTVAAAMPTMPKPVNAPPALVRVTLDKQAGERITLWGLGLDPAPADEPRVAVVFGRGRRIGSPLEGPLITRTAIQERLMIIGQDCECELDRAWMKGPLLPARWDSNRQQEAARTLGFDPENPLVRTEISRIVHRGPGTAKTRKLPGTGGTLGYSENALEELETTEQPQEEKAAEISNPVASGPVQSTNAPPLPDAGNVSQGGRPSVSLMLLGGAGLVALLGWWWVRIGRDQG